MNVIIEIIRIKVIMNKVLFNYLTQKRSRLLITFAHVCLPQSWQSCTERAESSCRVSRAQATAIQCGARPNLHRCQLPHSAGRGRDHTQPRREGQRSVRLCSKRCSKKITFLCWRLLQSVTLWIWVFLQLWALLALWMLIKQNSQVYWICLLSMFISEYTVHS